jgi:hypothetical protein
VLSVRKIAAFILALLPATVTFAAPLLPTARGTTWEYQTTLEAGEGVSFSHLKTDEKGQVRVLSIYRISGEEAVGGKNLLKFEMLRAGGVVNTDYLAIDNNGIMCGARAGEDGKVARLDPPQIVLAAPMKTGSKWTYDGKIADLQVHQTYEVLAEENVDVPAGKFHAFRIHSQQTTPISITLDRWFVPGTGFVKDVTAVRTTAGDLVQRVTLELSRPPRVAATQSETKTPTADSQKLSVGLAKEPLGETATKFPASVPKIYARWQGHGLPDHAKIRIVWIAEKVEEIDPDYKIDEASTVATAPDSHGTFTFAQPEDGFEPGDYRVEFYVDETLAQTVKLKMVE